MGYINTSGYYVVEPRFDDARNFPFGVAAVKAGDKGATSTARGSSRVSKPNLHLFLSARLIARTLASYLRMVQRNFTASRSFCGIRLRSSRSPRLRCHPRFQTMKRSLPGLTVQRTRLFIPTFWD